MGIDFGEKRIGVALSDPTGTLASPHDVVRRRASKRMPLKALERIARTHDVERLVAGLPLEHDLAVVEIDAPDAEIGPDFLRPGHQDVQRQRLRPAGRGRRNRVDGVVRGAGIGGLAVEEVGAGRLEEIPDAGKPDRDEKPE